MNLSLSDFFGGVLGKTNDGNVVMKQDQSGIEKANYGSFLGRIFTKVRKEPSNPVENAFLFAEIPMPSPDREEQFRKALLEASFFMRGTGGAVFSVNPDTGAYTLVQSERLDCLDPKAFFALPPPCPLSCHNKVVGASNVPRS